MKLDDDIVEGLRRHVGRAVSRLCPARLSAERDDIVQLAMLRVVKVMEASEATTPIASSYIWKCAFSATIDEIRRRDRRPETSLDTDDTPMRIAHESPSPEERLAGRELGAAIRGCLGTLPPDRRRGVVLFLLGHPPREVAARLGWGEKKADNLIYRGMSALRTCLAAKGIGP